MRNGQATLFPSRHIRTRALTTKELFNIVIRRPVKTGLRTLARFPAPQIRPALLSENRFEWTGCQGTLSPTKLNYFSAIGVQFTFPRESHGGSHNNTLLTFP